MKLNPETETDVKISHMLLKSEFAFIKIKILMQKGNLFCRGCVWARCIGEIVGHYKYFF